MNISGEWWMQVLMINIIDDNSKSELLTIMVIVDGANGKDG